MERLSHPQPPESFPELRYPEGWQEIFEAPDATDYQMWIRGLTTGTQERLLGSEIEWANSTESITTQWQRAIELVADIVIDPEEIPEMSQAEIIETALITMQANVEGIGWNDEYLAFTVPNMFSGEEATIDLRELPVN